MDRLPAIPLIVNDPYFSYWLPGDLPTDDAPTHWAGNDTYMHGVFTVDGKEYRYLGRNGSLTAETKDIRVTPTRTVFVMQGGPVQLTVTFWAPALPDDLDVLSAPATFIDFEAVSLDGKVHEISVRFILPAECCYDGNVRPALFSADYERNGLNVAWVGQKQQKLLCHSGDHVRIDWGYLYLASEKSAKKKGYDLEFRWDANISKTPEKAFTIAAYDDIASIDYFGVPCKAWYFRTRKNIIDLLTEFTARHDELLEKCIALDEKVTADAVKAAGEDYSKITAAAWRHCFGAHKLIATPEGEMALLSKENDSNGCIGTVDVSYPSIPLFLKYCPELVNALARPVLRFASFPVWKFDFAPHDVGRYPHVTGQVYALKERLEIGEVYPPYYLYGENADVYNDRNQMPVEECGNMLVMLASAIRFGADDQLARSYMDTLAKWVRYLDEYGEDPGEQLCTDDFAGHLAHNVNLSAKAIVGVRCYAEILKHFGDAAEALKWEARAQEMADSFLKRVSETEDTPLTFDGQGWSMKYNLVWDLIMDLRLLPHKFYEKETHSYLKRMNRYGLPLDSRADYTKSDWLTWCAAMAQDAEVKQAILKPLADYLKESTSRVAFSDWYDTKNGRFVHFIARPVQGGVFMPILADQ